MTTVEQLADRFLWRYIGNAPHVTQDDIVAYRVTA